MVLGYMIGERPRILLEELNRMDLSEVLRDERDFSIIVHGRVFFHEPLFSVLEFRSYVEYDNGLREE